MEKPLVLLVRKIMDVVDMLATSCSLFTSGMLFFFTNQMLTNVPLELTTVATMLCVSTPMDHTHARASLGLLEMEQRVIVKVILSDSRN